MGNKPFSGQVSMPEKLCDDVSQACAAKPQGLSGGKKSEPNPLCDAAWIWCAKAPDVNAYVDFKETLTLKQAPQNARCLVSADSEYALYINGALAFFGQYADYPDYKVYDELDIAQFLRSGDNEIKFVAYCTGKDTSVYRYGNPGICYRVDVDGKTYIRSSQDSICAVNANYRSGEIENITGQLGFTFDYDAAKAETAFASCHVKNGPAAFYPRPISKLDVLPERSGVILSQGVYSCADGETVGQRMQYAALSYRDFSALTGESPAQRLPRDANAPRPYITFKGDEGDGIYVIIDLEQEDAGVLSLDIEVDCAAEMLMGWGEHIDDLRPRTYVGKRNFAARYMAKAGRNEFVNPIRRIGLRYMMLFVAAHEFKLYYAGIKPTNYPHADRSEFSTADALHMRIYDVSRRTLEKCMHEHYEDCPWREQALYSMDSRNQMLCGYYAFGEYEFAKASLRQMALSQREDGMLELCSPARVPITIPSFSAIYMVQLQEYLLFSGDRLFAQEMLPYARKIADSFLKRRGANGLIPRFEGHIYWNFYEWQPYLEGYQNTAEDNEAVRWDAPLNCMVALGLNRLAWLMEELGAGKDARQYIDAANDINRCVNETFWDANSSCYYSFANSHSRWHRAELTQALAVCGGACPEDRRDAVLESLTNNALVPITLSHSIFQFDALMTRPEKYGRWVFAHVANLWGDMLYGGATTFWETSVGAWDFDNAGSLCHGWSAIPAYLYYAYALGIKPTKPGFAEYDIKPVTCGLYELTGKVALADGGVISVNV